MANSKNYNYENLDRPYDGTMQRSDEFGGTVSDIGTDNSGDVVSPTDTVSTGSSGASSNQSSSSNIGVITTDNLEDLWIHNFIKSRSYKPKSQGFLLDGEKGYIECMKLYVGTGGIIGGSLDIPDLISSGSLHIDSLGNIWSGSTTFNLAPFSVSNIGVLTATSGTIGGWQIQPSLLRSAGSGTRIELNQSKARISIFDAVNEKVVMGYLDGLTKHDGTGNWGVADYGFWALAGDKLSIDGDGEYTSGDWIVQHDAAYLINDGNNKTIVRLGTDTGEKGLFIYDITGTKLAKYTSTEIFVGETNKYLRYDTTNGLRIKGSHAELDVGSTGFVEGGQSAYNTLADGSVGGFWLGCDTTSGIYKLSLGSPTGDHLLWDGSALSITGNLAVSTVDIGGADASSFHVDASGNMWAGAATYDQNTNPFAVSAAGTLRATSAVVSGALSAGSGSSVPVDYLTAGVINAQTITLAGDNCYLNSGKTAFSNTDAGFILGRDSGGTAKFYIGDSSSYLNWTGSSLNISGTITGSAITGSTLSTGTSGFNTNITAAQLEFRIDSNVIGTIAKNPQGNTVYLTFTGGTVDAYSLYATGGSVVCTTLTSPYSGGYSTINIVPPVSFSSTISGSVHLTGDLTADGNVIVKGGVVQVLTSGTQRNYVPKSITVGGETFYVLAYKP